MSKPPARRRNQREAGGEAAPFAGALKSDARHKTGTAMETFVGEYGGEKGRPVWRAVRRGMLCRCPRCGKGKIFCSYLKVRDHCPVCKEELFHHRADDMPTYIALVIVGHVILALVLVQQEWFPDISEWLQMVAWPLLAAALCLGLLQPVKGAIIGVQWALRMHGFGGEPLEDSN